MNIFSKILSSFSGVDVADGGTSSNEVQEKAELLQSFSLNAVDDRFRDPYVKWIRHPYSGRTMGNFTVAMEQDCLVFSFDGKGADDFKSVVRDYLGDFFRLANLVTKKAGHDLSTVEKPWIRDFNPNEPYDFHWPCDVEYSDLDTTSLLELAAEIGPLFGVPVEGLTERVIKEPVSAWVYAAKIANFAIRAEAFIGDPVLNETSLDGDIAWSMLFSDDDLSTSFNASKNFDPNMPPIYKSLFKEICQGYLGIALQPKLAPHMRSVRYPSWVVADGDCRIEVREVMAFLPARFNTLAIIDPAEYRRFSPIEGGDVMSAEEALIEEMLQSLITVHTRRVGVDWSPVESKGKVYGVLDVSFLSYLERMWYSFGQQHAKAKFGVCEKCGKLFSADGQRRSKKRFCSKECQEREKSKRQRDKKKQ